MEKPNDDLKIMVNDEKSKINIKQAPESNEPSSPNKSAKSLGDGRWKYQGKTYKEESIGRS